MRRSIILATIFATVLILVLPFVGGAGPSPLAVAASAGEGASAFAAVQPVAVERDFNAALAALRHSEPTLIAAATPTATSDAEHLAQKPVPPPVVVSATGKASGTAERRAQRAAAGQSCPGNVGGSPAGAPGAVSGGGVQGTTSADIASFATNYNAIRVANCLTPVPMSHFRYDSCMETRLAWMAEDPSTSPGNTWGHAGVRSTDPDANGVYYSDAVPSRGCDGNLAGGSSMSGAAAAQRWWDSTGHRTSLYRPAKTGSMDGTCIYFAMTHGDGNLGNEPVSFNRAAARYAGC